MSREIDDDERRDAIDERRALARSRVCQCGPDMPGRCPGPRSCPYSDYSEEAEEDEELCSAT
ncbi:hypothetical protein ACJ4V0_15800 [Phreatobacter sp. HK31-P]